MIHPDPNLPWPIPLRAVHLIAEREQGPRGGPALKAYLCPAGVWTIGWGRIDGVKPGMTCTAAEADEWLCDDLIGRTARVQAMLTAYAAPNALGALVSLAYNIGDGGLKGSTVLRAHNAGDMQAASRAFSLWNKARVRGVLTVLPGLTSRRAAESALYLEPEHDDLPARMPQAVQTESSLAASPIAQGGAVTAGVGGLTLVQQAGEHAGTIGTALTSVKGIVVGSLGLPSWAFPLALIGVGGVVMYQRWKQRRGGWA